MGLCSSPEPVKVLQNMGHLCKPKTGRIILIEHGRGHYNFVNGVLDDLAPVHAQRHGCWWNRDILDIVKESGLNIVEVKRYHAGTTYWIELRPESLDQVG
jgi:methyltransferase OMS1